ncbi:MAG: DNA-processing protein DprA [Gemmobacter sp.]
MDEGLFSSTSPFTPPTTEDDRLSWLRLIRSRRVGPATFHRLIAEHGCAAAALAALPAVARAAGVRDYEPCPDGVAAAEIAAGHRTGAHMLCWGDPDYPPDLADLPDAPPVLWMRGDAALLRRPMVAIVGARNASSLGLRMARRLAGDLSAEGVPVVSGLARGIDAAAHEAALPGGTVAVMAGGIDVIYPAEHAPLAAAIADSGALISEQPPGTEPQARHFPLRNRIISGMALGLVVVEAAERSGSLITARAALDQGREVLAVPGHPVDARAAGCNALIRDGCTLVRGAADVIESLGAALAAARAARPAEPARPVQPARKPRGALAAVSRMTEAAGSLIRRAAPPPADMAALPSPAERPRASVQALHASILSRLGPSPTAEDQLIRDLALPAATVAAELVSLELEGRIERQPGGLIARSG